MNKKFEVMTSNFQIVWPEVLTIAIAARNKHGYFILFRRKRSNPACKYNDYDDVANALNHCPNLVRTFWPDPSQSPTADASKELWNAALALAKLHNRECGTSGSYYITDKPDIFRVADFFNFPQP